MEEKALCRDPHSPPTPSTALHILYECPLLDLDELDHHSTRSSALLLSHLITFLSTIHLAAAAFTVFVLAVPPNRAALAFAAIACIFSTFAARALAFLTLASLAADMSFPFAIAGARGFSFNERGRAGRKGIGRTVLVCRLFGGTWEILCRKCLGLQRRL
jgi:hypothetical protein